MPSEQLNSQSQTRPGLSTHRSTTNSGSDSPYGSPHGKPKVHTHKHVVGGGRGVHARVPSSKGLHKLTSSKVHMATEDSNNDMKKLARNSSATSLKKNASHVSLKRNRSTADIPRRPKSSHGQGKRPNSVHFEIGDQDQDQDQDEGWEEASQSASPALSRAVSSGKASANTSEAHSPAHSPSKAQMPAALASEERHATRNPSADAKALTERLLQRTPSQHTTKMSLATATPDTTAHHIPDSPAKSQSSLPNGTPKIGSNAEVVSRFVGGSGTPSEHSSFLQNRRSDTQPRASNDEVKRAQSMGNLTRGAESDRDDGEERALAPRSRKSSTTNAYVPPQQSRTQQKLWLQRASSNIEPQQMAPGLTSLHPGSSLVGAGYDGRDPRIKLQLERTGLEYLVVRRYQDPVGKALKRLSQLPGAEKNRRIPPQSQKKADGSNLARHGLSQSMKDNRMKEQTALANGGAGSSFGDQPGSQDDTGMGERGEGDDGLGAILRSMWEKSFELSASSD
jgi:hypothetical protein